VDRRRAADGGNVVFVATTGVPILFLAGGLLAGVLDR
jgi:hypothetical protein